MNTQTCTNGHKMTGIGGDTCPECEAPWVSSRDQLIEEIMQGFGKLWGEDRNSPFRLRCEAFLRTSLLCISDASMDAVEVGKNPIQTLIGREWTHEDSEKIGWNSAIAASKEKRELFTK